MRPVLANRRREEAEALYREREPYYARAHLTIETDGLGPDGVVHALLPALERPPVSPGRTAPARL